MRKRICILFALLTVMCLTFAASLFVSAETDADKTLNIAGISDVISKDNGDGRYVQLVEIEFDKPISDRAGKSINSDFAMRDILKVDEADITYFHDSGIQNWIVNCIKINGHTLPELAATVSKNDTEANIAYYKETTIEANILEGGTKLDIYLFSGGSFMEEPAFFIDSADTVLNGNTIEILPGTVNGLEIPASKFNFYSHKWSSVSGDLNIAISDVVTKVDALGRNVQSLIIEFDKQISDRAGKSINSDFAMRDILKVSEADIQYFKDSGIQNWIVNCIKINGYTLPELMATVVPGENDWYYKETTIEANILEGGTKLELVLLYGDTFMANPAFSVDGDNNLVQGNTIEISAAPISGLWISESSYQYDAATSGWVKGDGEKVPVVSPESFGPVTKETLGDTEYSVFTVEFNESLGKIEKEDVLADLGGLVFIDGKPLTEIAGLSIAGNKVPVYLKIVENGSGKFVMEISLYNGEEDFAYKLTVNTEVKIFGSKATEDFEIQKADFKQYYDGTSWVSEYEINKGEVKLSEIKDILISKDAVDSATHHQIITIEFEEECLPFEGKYLASTKDIMVAFGGVSEENADIIINYYQDFLKNNIKIKGRTIAEIFSSVSDAWAQSTCVNVQFESNLKVMRLVFECGKLTAEERETLFIKEVNGKPDPGDIITVEMIGGKLGGYTFPSFKKQYDNVTQKWYDEGEIPSEIPEFKTSAVSVVSLTKPAIDDNGHFFFEIKFDAPITYKNMIHINSGKDFMFTIADYTQSEIAYMDYFGILDSIVDNIKWNGETIRALSAKDVGYEPLAFMIHIDGDTMRFVISGGGRVNSIAPEDVGKENYTIEFLAGLKMPGKDIGAEIKETQKFYYYKDLGTWGTTEEVPAQPDNGTVILPSEGGCQNAIGIGSVGVAMAFLCCALSVILIKKR